MQYGHIYASICIIIKLKIMFWKLYTRIYFNIGTFNIEGHHVILADEDVSFSRLLWLLCCLCLASTP